MTIKAMPNQKILVIYQEQVLIVMKCQINIKKKARQKSKKNMKRIKTTKKMIAK